MNSTIECYKYHESGYFRCVSLAMIMNGRPNLPPRSTLKKPALREGFFYKFVGEDWVEEKKPTTLQECVAIGHIKHDTQEDRDYELREIFQQLTDGSRTHRLSRGDDLSWFVEEIPQEEKEAEAIQEELSTFDMKIEQLKERMSVAMLQNDQETVKQLQQEYKQLMRG